MCLLSDIRICITSTVETYSQLYTTVSVDLFNMNRARQQLESQLNIVTMSVSSRIFLMHHSRARVARIRVANLAPNISYTNELRWTDAHTNPDNDYETMICIFRLDTCHRRVLLAQTSTAYYVELRVRSNSLRSVGRSDVYQLGNY